VAGTTRLRVVISGCSGGGKSSLLAELANRGHAVVAEPGRRIVAEERASGGSALPWIDPAAFAERAIRVAIADLGAASRAPGFVFFDRGLIDAVAALEHATGRPSLHRAAGCRYFPTVFFAPPWPEIFVRDEDRRHGWDEAVEECRRLERAFVALGYTVRALPKIGVGASGPITSWRPCATARKTISDRMLRGEYSGGDAASRCSPTKSKWGRHRCRPHSHRCVATSEEANLASDVSPSFCTEAQSSGSVTGARTGIRIHPPAGSSRAIGAEAVSSLAYPTLNRRLRGRMPRTGPSSGCASSGPKTFRNAPIGRRPGGPARDEIPSHFLHRVPSVRPKPSARGHSRCARTDPATSFRFEFLPFYQAVRPSSSKEFRSVPIGLKLPPPTRFDKLARPRFSTFPRFRCGLRWISHRFVAESSCDTILRRLSRFQRSRFASRRSRRALSLMKPSASFWS